MEKEPKKTIELLYKIIKKNKEKNKLQPSPAKLVGALMNIPYSMRKHGIDFLQYCIDKLQVTDKSLHNILIFFLTEPP